MASRITEALIANTSAQSFLEWQQSGHTPNDIFRITRQIDSATGWTELCTELSKLSGENLALFEDEINDRATARKLGACHSRLVAKLTRYWAASAGELAADEDGAGDDAPAQPAAITLPSEERVVDTSSGPVISDGGLKAGEIALTFDDGPHPTRTERILKILKEAGVRATFFEVGEMAKHYSTLPRIVLNDGHTVGSHSWNHPQLPQLDFASAQKNIVKGHEAVIAATGIESSFFRFPYGARNKALQKFVSGLGMATFFWNMDSSDWKLRNPAQLFQNVLQELSNAKGGIILFHDIQEQTVVVLPSVLRELKKRNFKTIVFVPKARTPRP
ncbi:MAG: polysaccharide deacetylase family protein [Deltaproteobacteria bacterium]|nr:polysaccharide deacetylase family protein [Deltaproteobacteria bacterium]